MTETGDAAGRRYEALSKFWAGYMEELRVSPARHRVVMTVWVSERVRGAPEEDERRVRSWYELAFEGVTRFTFADVHTAPWWNMELTEITQRAVERGTAYWFTLTEIEDALHIVCDDVRARLIDQDEWPDRPAR